MLYCRQVDLEARRTSERFSCSEHLMVLFCLFWLEDKAIKNPDVSVKYFPMAQDAQVYGHTIEGRPHICVPLPMLEHVLVPRPQSLSQQKCVVSNTSYLHYCATVAEHTTRSRREPPREVLVVGYKVVPMLHLTNTCVPSVNADLCDVVRAVHRLDVKCRHVGASAQDMEQLLETYSMLITLSLGKLCNTQKKHTILGSMICFCMHAHTITAKCLQHLERRKDSRSSCLSCSSSGARARFRTRCSSIFATSLTPNGAQKPHRPVSLDSKRSSVVEGGLLSLQDILKARRKRRTPWSRSSSDFRSRAILRAPGSCC
jgi:hypothetical protein